MPEKLRPYKLGVGSGRSGVGRVSQTEITDNYL